MGLLASTTALLRSAPCASINFRLRGIVIKSSDYGLVAGKMEQRVIQLAQSALLPSSTASYNRKLNVMFVGAAPGANLIVHESTHAVMDINRKRMTTEVDESVAMVAQSMYLLQVRRDIAAAMATQGEQRVALLLNQCQNNDRACDDATVFAAGLIALQFLNNQPVSGAMIQRLGRGVRQHTAYGIGSRRDWTGCATTASAGRASGRADCPRTRRSSSTRNAAAISSFRGNHRDPP